MAGPLPVQSPIRVLQHLVQRVPRPRALMQPERPRLPLHRA